MNGYVGAPEATALTHVSLKQQTVLLLLNQHLIL